MYTGAVDFCACFCAVQGFARSDPYVAKQIPRFWGKRKEPPLRKLTILLALVGAALLLVPGTALAKGVSGPAIYVDGQAYRTVGTPTDFSETGAPAHSFDIIYDIEGQMNVATAAPGDTDYNGGRWMVHALEVLDLDSADTNDSGDLDSAAEVEAAIANNFAVDNGVVKYFECPIIKLPATQR